jgi:hypothetical protein
VPLVAAPVTEIGGTATSLSANLGQSDGVRRTGKRSAATGVSATENNAVLPLDSELKVLRQAREDMRAGLPDSAYQRLIDYDRHYGKGPLWQERQALTAIALCQWRPGPEAQTRASDFLREAPQSPLADRVRSACKKSNAAAE